MAVLIILSGKHQGKRLTLPDGEVVIGRDEACQVRLATNEVSRFHCRLRCTADQVMVSDLDSRNGTLINDLPIRGETELNPGDTLRVGPVAFQLAAKKAAAATSPGPTQKKPSDDSIMDWLADEDEGKSQSKAGDTTIIPTSSLPPPAAAPPPAPAISPETPLPPQKRFKTIGAEGEDIIQRHLELVQEGKLPKRVPALQSQPQ